MEEIWKDIEGFHGIYRVSNIGNVMSLNYCNRGYKKLLTPKCNNRGRLWVELVSGEKRRCALIHRLVAEAFIPNPDGFPQINHKDENPKNNNVENLEWCTQEYNQMCYYKNHGLNLKKQCQRNRSYEKRTHLRIEQISKEGDIVRTWENSAKIKSENGWSDWSISECCRGKRKTAYGYIWRYCQ